MRKCGAYGHSVSPVRSGTLNPLQCAGVMPIESVDQGETADEPQRAAQFQTRDAAGATDGRDEGRFHRRYRKNTMRNNAEQMGKQFLLSDREVEVLTLYALGLDAEARVAEALHQPQHRTPTSSIYAKQACTPAKNPGLHGPVPRLGVGKDDVSG